MNETLVGFAMLTEHLNHEAQGFNSHICLHFNTTAVQKGDGHNKTQICLAHILCRDVCQYLV